MALTFTTFSTFKEVEDWYNRTTPLRGSNNAGKDIRPIGDRNRKFERIVKISANCYALSDGYHFGDPETPTWYYGARKPNFVPSEMAKYAPIVWRRKRDGTEEVTLRNGWGEGAHNGRYAFLYRHTPKGMWFRNRNGKHFIQLSSPVAGGREYYLAKTRTAPREVYDAIRRSASTHYWQKRTNAWVRSKDCNSAVTFRRLGVGEWEHVEGTGREVPGGPKVNKEAKAKYKDRIKTFFEWGMTMSPLLPIEDMEYRTTHSHDLHNYFKPKDQPKHVFSKPTAADLRGVVSDEGHPMRLALWVQFAAGCTDDAWGFSREYYTKTVQTKEDLARVRSRYHTWINKALGFIK